MINKKGFTLIELLVVIAIIGLLSTLAVVALNSARSKARDAKRVSDIKQIQTSLELYYADNSGYAGGSALALGGSGGAASVCIDSGGFKASGCTNAYMPVVPAQTSTGLKTGGIYQSEYLYSGAPNADGSGTACATAPCTSYRIDFQTESVPSGYPTCSSTSPADPTKFRANPSGVICDPD